MEYTYIKTKEELQGADLDLFTKYNEAQLLHYYEPHGGLFIAETAMIVERALEVGCEPVCVLVEDKMTTQHATLLEKLQKVPIYVAPLEVLTNLTGYNLTRGILCAMKRPKLSKAEEILAENIVVLEDVMNPTNMGAIFRSAAALNVGAILLTKNCTDPLYRRSARVSMGTVFQIPWAYLEAEVSFTKMLHEEGYSILSMALRDHCSSLGDPELLACKKKAIVMGTEATGISEAVLNESDYIVKIPMTHGVDSLNVAAASAVTFWELCMGGKKR